MISAKQYFAPVLAALMLTVSLSSAQANPDVPENITTPDKIDTQTLGQLSFTDGYPSESTIAKVQRYMLVQRAVNVFADGIPAASLHAILTGLESIGVEANKGVAISEQLFDKNMLWLTPNTTTVYIMIGLDVKDGPMVFDLQTSVLGFIDDAFFKYVGDVGIPNPQDKGKGGKYILAHESYEGDIPENHIELRTETYRHWFLMRLNSVDQIPQFKKTFRMHRLGEKFDGLKYVDFSNKKHNTVHANNIDFYHELNYVIQYEPETAGDPHFKGMAASIGIEKGKPFDPSGDHLAALMEAAAIANVHARSESFKPTNRDAYFYGKDRQWFLPFGSTMSFEFIKDGRLYNDDRTVFHYIATGITPLMTAQFDGQGSSYIAATTDSNGEPFSGDAVYEVTLPPDPPMKRFWSFMVYDNQTRSILPTDQRSGGFDSTGDVAVNDDGSVTVTFSANRPTGDSNWVQTLPGKGFFVMFRMYSPTQEWHDRRYVIGDLVKM